MKNHFTSLQLSKKLAEAGCGLPGSARYSEYWQNNPTTHIFVGKLEDYDFPIIEAYDIMNDICVRYAEQFFDEEFALDVPIMFSNNACKRDGRGYKIHPIRILQLMQQGKKAEAEKYIEENSIFFNNKKKR